MSIASRENVWWWDVLENGKSSRYAFYFDVDWNPSEEKLRNRILIPILGDHYGRVIDAVRIAAQARRRLVHRELSRARDADRPAHARRPAGQGGRVRQRSTTWPSSPMRSATSRSRPRPTGRASPAATATRRSSGGPWRRSAGTGRSWPGPSIASSTRSTRSPAEIDALLERQNYRLAYWRTAGQELDYRRFFDINTLVSLRTEELTRLPGHARTRARLDAPGGPRRPPGRPPRRAAQPQGVLRAAAISRPPRAGSSSRRSSSPARSFPRTGPSPGRSATTSSTRSTAC